MKKQTNAKKSLSVIPAKAGIQKSTVEHRVSSINYRVTIKINHPNRHSAYHARSCHSAYQARSCHSERQRRIWRTNGTPFNSPSSVDTYPGIKPIRLFCLLLPLIFIAPGCEKKPTKTLHQAAAGGDIAQVKLHISRGADLNAKNNLGTRPIHEAAHKGRIDIAELLIANGADINVKDRYAVTPLHVAVDQGHRNTAEFLPAKGADLTAKINQGITVLTMANIKGDKQIIKLLVVDYGAKE